MSGKQYRRLHVTFDFNCKITRITKIVVVVFFHIAVRSKTETVDKMLGVSMHEAQLRILSPSDLILFPLFTTVERTQLHWKHN